MSFPFGIQRMLVTAPLDEPLRIVSITFPAVRDRCTELGIRVGDRVTCRESSAQHVLIEIAGRGARWLGNSLAVCIEVEPVESRSASTEGVPGHTSRADIQSGLRDRSFVSTDHAA